MSNERMLILEMVKDGKISVDEGVKLLNAINKNNSSDFENFTNDLKCKLNNIPKPDTEKIKQNTQAFLNKTEEFIDDFAKSVRDFFNTNDNDDNNVNSQQNQTINVEQVEPNNTNENKENNSNNQN